MKKQILLAGIAAMVAMSCEKKTPETVTTETTQTTETTETPTETTTVTVDSTKTATTGNVASTSGDKMVSTTKYEGDGKNVTATFMGDEAGKMSVKISVDGKETTLPQKNAWAKGATYSDGKTEFTSNGQSNTGELKIDGKTYQLKEVK